MNYTHFIFSQLIKCAEKYNFELFLVGGKVRDLLLKSKNFSIFKGKSYFFLLNYILKNTNNFDFDFTLVNENFYDALYFSEIFREYFKKNIFFHEFFIKKNKDFLTVNIIIKFKNYYISFDIATFRKENYQFFGSLPKVSYSKNILDDAYRRDITINSIYIKLTKNIILIDKLGGEKDLNKKIIKLNYKYSLFDDPTRIIRIIKLKSRLNMNFSSDTILEMKLAKYHKVYKYVSNFRIFNEIKKTFSENSKNNITIKNFIKDILIFNFIEILSQHKKFHKKNYKKFCLDLKNFEQLKKEKIFFYNFYDLQKISFKNFGFFVFLIFLKNLPIFEIKNIAKKFPFNKFEKKIILNLICFLQISRGEKNLFKKNIDVFLEKKFKNLNNIDYIVFLIAFYNNKIIKERFLKILKFN